MQELAQFMERQRRLADSLQAAGDKLESLGHPSLAASLTAQARNSRDFSFRIAVVGEFSSGKSTLLNALLGEALLPAKMPPCTAAPVSIRYGPTRRLLIRKRCHDTDHEAPFSQLKEVLELRADTEEEVARERAARGIERVTLEVPLDLCKNGVIFFDSPGLNEAQARSELTLELLPNVDTALVLLRATELLSATEREFLNNEASKTHADRRWMDHAFVLVSFADVASQDEDLTELRKRLDEFCDQNLKPHTLAPRRRFFIDGRSALNRQINKKTASDGVDFTRFVEELQRFLVSDRGEAGWKSQVISAVGTIGKAQEAISAEASAHERDAAQVLEETDRVRKVLKKERDRLDRIIKGLREYAPRLARDLGNDFLAASGRWLNVGLASYLSTQVYPETILANPKPPTEWFAKRSAEWLERQMQHWSGEVPGEKLRELISDFEREYREDLAEMQRNLSESATALGLPTLADSLMVGEEGTAEWLVRAAAGWLVGGPFAAAFGSVLGWNGILKNLGMQFAIYLGAWMVGFAIPFYGQVALLATLALAQVMLGQSGIQEKLRQKVLEECRKSMPAKFEEGVVAIGGAAKKMTSDLADELARAGGRLVGQLEEAAAKAEDAARSAQAVRASRLAELEKAQTLLSALHQSVEASSK